MLEREKEATPRLFLTPRFDHDTMMVLIAPLLLTVLFPLPRVTGFAPSCVQCRSRRPHASLHDRKKPWVDVFRSTSLYSTASSSYSSSASLTVNTTQPGSVVADLAFPCYQQLALCSRGESFDSDPFSIVDRGGTEHRFRVLLSPRGGGHATKRRTVFNDDRQDMETSGFGMNYKVLPVFGDPEEKVGVYLQYLPADPSSSVDATFTIRLKGNQSTGPRFDVEWGAGIRFVPVGNLREGIASDFGSHFMNTLLLREFMGDIPDDTDEDAATAELGVQVSVVLHQNEKSRHEQSGRPSPEGRAAESTSPQSDSERLLSRNPLAELLAFDDIRTVSDRNGAVDTTSHNPETARCGKLVVPLFQTLKDRDRMFAMGVYPGVEYRIMNIVDSNGQDAFYSSPGCKYAMRPIYPLVDQLERAWPVTVQEDEIPKLVTVKSYNVISAIGSLFTAVTGLFTAFLLSQAVSLFFIPSKSMEPTLAVGDVLVVEKVSPRLFNHRDHPGDVVLFQAPPQLESIVTANGGRVGERDLFVKRVVAEAGDQVDVDDVGKVLVNQNDLPGNRNLCGDEPGRLIEKLVRPATYTVHSDEVFVLGDCAAVSVDGRVWGTLPSKQVVGKPLFRIWPLERFGFLPSISDSSTNWFDSMTETDWKD